MLELPLGEAAATFELEKAVCSHGLFMMAPNFWDPQSKTFQRSLRLSLDYNHPDHEVSVNVRISQPSDFPRALQLQVFGADSLSNQHSQSLLGQVRSMLRLSDEDNKNVLEFHEIFSEAKMKGFGRIFRSPTLFEDMVKCILLCNCQWSRTLSMAKALCELQWELQQPPAKARDNSQISCHKPPVEHFIPKTPAVKETIRKLRVKKRRVNLLHSSMEAACVNEEIKASEISCNDVKNYLNRAGECSPDLHEADEVQDFEGSGVPFQASSGVAETSSCSSDVPFSDGSEDHTGLNVGNFPSPKELASLDEAYLAQRCGLGYRASRVLNLAKFVVEGRIQMQELEEACRRPSQCCYEKLLQQLIEIDGFGPFTCSNVLMCMGFYHVIPTDSETIRHLKQVHATKSTLRSVQKDVENIYGKYAPFQFLAYWYEVWQFYEKRFGNTSEMAPASYKLITAANMKPKKTAQRKRLRVS